jgi:hypothetical protein
MQRAEILTNTPLETVTGASPDRSRAQMPWGRCDRGERPAVPIGLVK